MVCFTDNIVNYYDLLLRDGLFMYFWSVWSIYFENTMLYHQYNNYTNILQQVKSNTRIVTKYMNVGGTNSVTAFDYAIIWWLRFIVISLVVGCQ